MNNKQFKVVVLAFENISIFHLSVPCLVFQDAFINQHCPFEFKVVSLQNQTVKSSAGLNITFPDNNGELECADIIIIPSWPNALPSPSSELINTLQRGYQRGAILVGLCLGTFVLAETGLLNGKSATTHWAFASILKERFPEINVDASPLFVEENRILTSAGTAASLDCCLHIVRRLVGNETATHLARLMVTAPFRSGGQQQFIPEPVPNRYDNPTRLSQIILSVAERVNDEWNIDKVAELCAMSRRTFTRNFKAHYGCTFGEWIKTQRLKLSQTFLESTEHSITQVATMSGFGSESVYRKYFKSAFGVSPVRWRESFHRDAIDSLLARND